MKSSFITLRLYMFGVCAVCTCRSQCTDNEYLSEDGECCSLCNTGSVVLTDCTGNDHGTKCQPCSEGTYLNQPNGFKKCLPCKTCETGFYILQNCTAVKNTVCEVSDGHYCTDYSDYSDDECTRAVKHTECKPGQQIQTPGTKTSDTVCESCPPGSYSPTGVNCSKWTDCSAINQMEYEEGNSIRDVQCKPEMERYGLAAALLILFLLIPFLLIFLYWQYRQSINNSCRGFNQQNDNGSACASSLHTEEENQEKDSYAVNGF